ncbi:hypothetical protein SDC9_176011 [bioreactor metagenome]|uniref:Uncharacterized protein n=1 Tax=bioreactor metagenome TaxID=1076179 RepID=A0A645GRV6_9ZZZZ
MIEKNDRDGYDWISEQYGVAIKKESSIRMVYRLGTCAMSEKAKYHGK